VRRAVWGGWVNWRKGIIKGAVGGLDKKVRGVDGKKGLGGQNAVIQKTVNGVSIEINMELLETDSEGG